MSLSITIPLWDLLRTLIVNEEKMQGFHPQHIIVCCFCLNHAESTFCCVYSITEINRKISISTSQTIIAIVIYEKQGVFW